LPEEETVHLEELRGFLLSERDSGTIVQIPHDLYQTTATLIRTLQQEVIIMDDPFSDEARLLIEKVASIRVTAEELFQIRSEKIIDLAQSQAEGSYIEREVLKTLIPAELEMFNRTVETIRACRSSLIEWRVGGLRTQPPMRAEIPQRLADQGAVAQPESADNTVPGESLSSLPEEAGIISGQAGEMATSERAYGQEEGGTLSDDEEEQTFPYMLVRVKAEIGDPILGVDGRNYDLAAGDIVTLPRRNAEVFVERNIVLNINPG
jgi:DNA replication factor GINS